MSIFEKYNFINFIRLISSLASHQQKNIFNLCWNIPRQQSYEKPGLLIKYSPKIITRISLQEIIFRKYQERTQGHNHAN